MSRAIASAQSQVEARNAEIRKNVLKYDDVLSKQREVVYGTRREILMGDDVEDMVTRFMDYDVTSFVGEFSPQGSSWDLEGLWTELRGLYPIGITVEDIDEEAGGRHRVTAEMLIREITSDIHLAYERREEEIGEEQMRALERRVVLSVLDRKWREHLYEMDYLKEGIGLRVMAQRDPVVEYRNEGYDMFQAMDDSIKEESVRFLFNVQIKKPEDDDGEGAATSASAAFQPAPGAQAAIANKLAGAAASTSGRGAGATSAPLAQTAPGLGLGAAGAARSTAAPILGLEPPARPTALSYSASAKDGSGRTAVTGEQGVKGEAKGSGGQAAAAAAGGNRAQRRAAERAAKKRK